MGKLLLTRPLKLICTAEPRTAHDGSVSPLPLRKRTQSSVMHCLDTRTYVRHLCAACFNAKLAAFSRKIMFHSHYIALMTNVGRCKCTYITLHYENSFPRVKTFTYYNTYNLFMVHYIPYAFVTS